MASTPDSQLKALKKRVRALERAVSALQEAAPAASVPASSAPAAPSPAAPDPALQEAGHANAEPASPGTAHPTSTTGTAPPTPASPEPGPTSSPDFAPLRTLRTEGHSGGAVRFVGTLRTDQGPVEYQWTRPGTELLAMDWAEHAERITALGHPLRLTILRHLLDGPCTVAHLVDELDLGSTGVAYHHLSALQHAGWVTSPRRGSWALPPARIIPLTAIIIATEA